MTVSDRRASHLSVPAADVAAAAVLWADAEAIVKALIVTQRRAQEQFSSPGQASRVRRMHNLLLGLLLSAFDPPVEITVQLFRDGVQDWVRVSFPGHEGASFSVPVDALDQSARVRVAATLGRADLHPGFVSRSGPKQEGRFTAKTPPELF